MSYIQVSGTPSENRHKFRDAAGELDEELKRLLTSIANNETRSLDRLCSLTAHSVNHTVYSLLNNQADAQETIWSVYTQVWEQASRYDPSRGHVMAWISTIAKSRSLDVLRSRRTLMHQATCTSSSIDETVSSESSYENEESLDTARTLNPLIAQLPTLQQTLLTLFYSDQYTHQEIAQLMNLPLGTVKSHLRRSLAYLKKIAHGTHRNAHQQKVACTASLLTRCA